MECLILRGVNATACRTPTSDKSISSVLYVSPEDSFYSGAGVIFKKMLFRKGPPYRGYS